MGTPPNRILPRTENYFDAICYENGGVTKCEITNCLRLTSLCKLSLTLLEKITKNQHNTFIWHMFD